MKPVMMIGITQPDVRRVASITSTMSAMPNAMSSGVGFTLRSVKASPLRTM